MILALFLILVALNAIDAVQTIKALSGGYDEINPIGRFLFARLGLTGGVIAFKALVLTAAGLVNFLAPTAYGLALTIPLIGWGIFAVVHNYNETKG
jgi:hypothetical protein